MDFPNRIRRNAILAAAVAGCFGAGAALANPTGHRVVNGTAQVTPNGNVLEITNTPNTIIQWRQFSIGADETTRFVQESAASAVLNRVTGGSISRILGTLESNGRVFLINRNGIVFGPDAQVDVAGLVASALNMTNQDFLNERLRFRGGSGSVTNQGNITTDEGREVYLIGRNVLNSGTLESPDGEIVLAAGAAVELVEPGTPNLRVELSPTGAANIGQISQNARAVGIFAGLNRGASATQATTTADGRVVLQNGQTAGQGTQAAQAQAGAGAGGAANGGTTNGGTTNGTGTAGAGAGATTAGTAGATGTGTANGAGTGGTSAGAGTSAGTGGGAAGTGGGAGAGGTTTDTTGASTNGAGTGATGTTASAGTGSATNTGMMSTGASSGASTQ